MRRTLRRKQQPIICIMVSSPTGGQWPSSTYSNVSQQSHNAIRPVCVTGLSRILVGACMQLFLVVRVYATCTILSRILVVCVCSNTSRMRKLLLVAYSSSPSIHYFLFYMLQQSSLGSVYYINNSSPIDRHICPCYLSGRLLQQTHQVFFCIFFFNFFLILRETGGVEDQTTWRA